MNRRAFLASAIAIGSASLPRVRKLQRQVYGATQGLVCTPFNVYGVQECVAGIQSSILDVVASDTQHASEWCWAACIEAIFAYYGHPVSQERIVQEAYGDIVNMPGSPSTVLHALNREWVDDNGNKFRVRSTIIGTTAVNAAQDLAEDHPLIIGTLGHAMVLSALTYQRSISGAGQVTLAQVRDPWPLNPQHRALTPAEWHSIAFAARIRVIDV